MSSRSCAYVYKVVAFSSLDVARVSWGVVAAAECPPTSMHCRWLVSERRTAPSSDSVLTYDFDTSLYLRDAHLEIDHSTTFADHTHTYSHRREHLNDERASDRGVGATYAVSSFSLACVTAIASSSVSCGWKPRPTFT